MHRKPKTHNYTLYAENIFQWCIENRNKFSCSNRNRNREKKKEHTLNDVQTTATTKTR